jgi:hypothetical protein
MVIKRIHVNQHTIKANRKSDGTINAPTLSVIARGKTIHGYRVGIDGPSEVVYSPDKPLSCGAHVYIETRATVSIQESLTTTPTVIE